MGLTITEKILAKHSEKDTVSPGEFIEVSLDFAFANDITAPVAISEFKKIGTDKVFNPRRIAFIPDHFAPCKDLNSARQIKAMRDFAEEQGIFYFEVGKMGIEHAFLPEQGFVLPGDVVVGADSHTTTHGALGAFAAGVGSTDLAAAMATGKIWLKVPASLKFVYKGKLKEWVSGKDLILFTIGEIGVDGALYKAIEFSGEVIKDLSMDSRFAMANMVVEAGAKSGIFEPDEKTLQYVEKRAKREWQIYKSDSDAYYEKIVEFDVSGLEPQVACPHLPSNVKPVSEVKGIRLDQVVIGSCTNGRLEDLEVAASLLRGRKVSSTTRLIIIPATQEIYREALKRGLIEIFIEAGATVSTPTCGPCLGGHMGVLAEDEVALATTNRNFVGRMGHPKSKVYLSNPAVAAASAVAGMIISPDEL